jgi:hypothetical protein
MTDNNHLSITPAVEAGPVPEDFDEQDDPGECGNCGGSGVVHDCIDGQCLDSDEGCDLCERRCDWCRPRRPATPQTEARS